MSDMHMQENIRKVTEAAKEGKNVSERSKNVGFILFLLFVSIFVLVLFALIAGFIINKSFVAAAITTLITFYLIFFVYKLITTKNITSL
ncbi:hypothetical protein ACFSFY_15430 [Sporosarcina siberiensis]|uniref:Uncharacterized protein n=1 Tax=Sporosarcina siberiensis TaxID=1365606 RepID=A0ABW4SIU2_9BACL